MRNIKFRAWDGDRFINPSKFHIYGDGKISDKLIVNEFTGFKDKNGKEIYEGDIVKKSCFYADKTLGVSWQVFGKIFYDRGCFFCDCPVGGYEATYNKKLSDLISDSNPEKYSCEIVGNIYENPEMLKNKNF